AAPAQPPAAESADPRLAPPVQGESTVEQQLEKSGNAEEAQGLRKLREKLETERRQLRDEPGDRDRRDGDRRDRDARDGRGDRDGRADRDRRDDRDGRVVERRGDRVIIDLGGGRTIIRQDDTDERLLYQARDVEVERLRGGFTRTVVSRDNGSQIVTIRDRDGDIVERFRVTRDGRETYLINNRDRDRGPDRRRFVRYEDTLPRSEEHTSELQSREN